jgi:hypothetical protein
VEAEPDTDGEADGQPGTPPDAAASTTVGTGSVLGLGCVVALILLVIVALAIRWFAGGW